ncbi:MAG: VUT family protein [Actinomycetota bacterium]|nr:VUT family protein [Actinomycetota bacterium]
MDRRRLRKVRIAAAVSFATYVAVIVGANWMIGHVGTPIPGAHVLPVGFGLQAPSGVYLAALAFVARDMLQRVGGAKAGVAAILVGAGISAFVASAHLAFASGATFLLSETCDFLIYTPLQKRNFPLAVLASGVVGDVVDSTVFLTLAGIPLALALPGQLLGKLWVMLLGGLLAAWMRRYPLFATPTRSLSAAGTAA